MSTYHSGAQCYPLGPCSRGGTPTPALRGHTHRGGGGVLPLTLPLLSLSSLALARGKGASSLQIERETHIKYVMVTNQQGCIVRKGSEETLLTSS